MPYRKEYNWKDQFDIEIIYLAKSQLLTHRRICTKCIDGVILGPQYFFGCTECENGYIYLSKIDDYDQKLFDVCIKLQDELNSKQGFWISLFWNRNTLQEICRKRNLPIE